MATAAAARVPRVVPAAIALAWTVAIAVHVTGWGHRLHPGGAAPPAMPAMPSMPGMEHMSHMPATASAPPWPLVLALYAGAWMVMVAAMMLPSATPMLRLFAVASAPQPH